MTLSFNHYLDTYFVLNTYHQTQKMSLLFLQNRGRMIKKQRIHGHL